MGDELKVRSLRADNETYEKFQQLAEAEFGNQGQCLSTLINLYETEKSKTILVNRGLEIESFQDYLNKISGLFITSLQLNQDAEGRIREEFARQLESKDQTILDLQMKVNNLTVTNDAYVESSKLTDEENQKLKSTVSELEEIQEKQSQDFNSALKDKDSLNKALTDSLNERKAENEALRTSEATAKEQLKNLESIELENRQLKIDLENLKNENKRQKENAENEIERQREHSEIEKDKAMTALEKEHQQEIKKLNEQNNSKIQELLEKIEKLQQPKEKKELKTNRKGAK